MALEPLNISGYKLRSMKKISVILSFFLIAAALIAGGYFSMKSDRLGEFSEGNNPDVPTLVFYTSSAVTTPQLAFWAALRKGRFSHLFNLKVRLWQNTDDLQSVVLAGKGDLWLAHTEGFAMAAKRGAPVTLLAVTGWRKFHIVTSRHDYKDFASLKDGSIAFAPPGTPAVHIFNELMGSERNPVDIRVYQGRQLALLMLDERVDTAILPEPLVSMLLMRNKKLRVVESLEELYGRMTGSEPFIPLAGLAMNRNTAGKYPEIAKAIQYAVMEMSAELKGDSAGAVEWLPAYFEKDMPKEVVRQSMKRDIIMAERAAACEAALARYFRMVLPSMTDGKGRLNLDRGFLWAE